MTAVEWDARMALAFGSFIARYLAENPPPPDSEYGQDARRWGERLMATGRNQFQFLDARPLAAVTADDRETMEST